MRHSLLSRLLVLTTMAAAAAGALPANDALAGAWRHDAGASDLNYITGEYPGRRLEIVVLEDGIRVTESLGGVRNGIPLPGSGDESQTWELPTDGVEHEIPLGQTMRRSAAATWEDGALRLRFRVLGPASLEFEELWSVSDDRRTLTVDRRRADDGKRRRLVYRRLASAEGGG